MQSINLHLRSVDAHLRSIDAKEDSNTREIQKVGTVVTVVSKKVLTRETFDRYFRPVLNFDYPGLKKNGIPYPSFCTQSLDTSKLLTLQR
jgi:hypothetical protein